jgi:hypothetical protein
MDLGVGVNLRYRDERQVGVSFQIHVAVPFNYKPKNRLLGFLGRLYVVPFGLREFRLRRSIVYCIVSCINGR